MSEKRQTKGDSGEGDESAVPFQDWISPTISPVEDVIVDLADEDMVLVMSEVCNACEWIKSR